MKTSEKGIKLITDFEGCGLIAYQDAGGVWTIGYGHTAGVKPDQKITKQQAQLYLMEDLKKFEKYVMAYDKYYHFNQNQFDALVSFCYNAGPGNLAKLLDKGNKPIDLVKYDILNSCIKAKGQVLNGLIRRRDAESELMGDCRRDLDLVVADVIAGLYGSGLERRRKLTNAGYDYKTIQAAVNEKLKK